MMATELPELLPIAEVARRLSLTRHSVYALLDSGKLEGVYQGRRRAVTAEALRAYVDGLSSTRGEAIRS